MTRRLIVGISGASAPQLGLAVLRALRQAADIETHLVVSRGARRTISVELGIAWQKSAAQADVTYPPEDLAAAISSGPFRTIGTVVVPCSAATRPGCSRP